MSEPMIDLFSRRAASTVSRRASLTALGMAGVLAPTRPMTTTGKKNKKGKLANSAKRDKQRCQQDLVACNAQGVSCAAQAEDCTALLSAICAGDPLCPEFVTCCSFLGDCNATAFLTCLTNVD